MIGTNDMNQKETWRKGIKLTVALIACYNSEETIRKCLESLRGRVDKILCFDARWEGFPYPSPYSDDLTESLINCLKDSGLPVKYIQLCTPIHQVDMRNAMIGHVADGDWILVIDADEHVIRWDDNVKEILETTPERGYRLCMKVPRSYAAYPTMRLIKKTQGLKYTTDHRLVVDDNGVIDVLRFPLLMNIIFDNHELADKKRMRQYMNEYKDWLIKWEEEQRNK